jgi:nucleoside-diphosphate-sugar epimerase
MCRHFREDFGLCTRVARYHNVYGPNGTWDGGREKAPAAICRKVIEAKLSGRREISIWGDGSRTRSYMYIDDCLKGTQMMLASEVTQPVNVGSSEMVSVNQLVDIVEDIAGVKLARVYEPDAPQGVVGRNSDNTLIRSLFGWEPRIPLRKGLEVTYAWIYDQMVAREVQRRAAAR